MKRLEETLGEISSEEKDSVGYEGLQTLSDVRYEAGTSIKYWM